MGRLLLTCPALRAMVLAAALPPPAPLAEAMERLEFVQYDPIRRPACAQDLILRHRATDYRRNDLATRYSALDLEEDILYVYGAMSQRLHRLIHPRNVCGRPGEQYRPDGLAADVLAALAENGPLRTRDVTARLGGGRAVNDWGGVSAASTRALEELHYHGLVRVARREGGVKVYEVAAPLPHPRGKPEDRMAEIARHVLRSLGPLPQPSLRAVLVQTRRNSGLTADPAAVVRRLIDSGECERHDVEGLPYLIPADTAVPLGANDSVNNDGDAITTVRFMAPFDPLAWDRCRFEHLWGWAYRFEAYIPPAKRRLGYYAMPLFVGDRAVGWVNCWVTAGGSLDVTDHYVNKKPAEREFRQAFDREVESLKQFLRLRER